MDESHNGFTFDDNYYNVGQFAHINNDNHSFNFSSTFVDESSLNAGDSFFVKIHGENDVLRRAGARNSNEIKSEPIKAELNDVNLTQSRITRSNSNSGAQDEAMINRNITSSTRFPICFKCEKCPFISVSQSGVEAHISQFHSNIYENTVLHRQKMLCPGCENVFYVKHSLEVHLEYDHLMNKDEIQALVDRVISASNSPESSDNRRSRIYLKNVDFLCNRPLEKSVSDSQNVTQDIDLIDLINDSHENSNECQQNQISIRNPDELVDVVRISEDEVTLNQNESNEFNANSSNKNFCELSSSITNDAIVDVQRQPSPSEGVEKRRRPKIYIKNVDILKEPIFVPTNNFANVLNVNADLSTLALFPPPPENQTKHIYNLPLDDLPYHPSVQFDQNTLETPKNKIYIKNVDVLRGANFYETPKKLSNSLHLRTVDELNLMNKREVQSLFNPILDPNCLSAAVNIPSSENSKNSDEGGIVNCNTPPELEYHRDDDVMHMNWTNDYGFDGLENIIDSSSSATSAEQKNPHFDLNTPQRSICDDHDKDMLFVCAQELINSNSSGNQGNDDVNIVDVEKQQDLSFCMNSTLPNMEEQEVVEILDDLEKQTPIQDNVALIPEKGRIYVADNLMDHGKNNEEAKKKSRGRPLGSKRTWVTSIKPRNKKAATEIGYKCDQNCGMRFLKLETLEIHKKCHASLSSQRMKCPVCNSTNYTSWDTLHTHLWRSHQIDMDLYSCQHCDFKTPILSRLVNTHSKIHSDERNFKCEQCSKCFKNSKQLKNHRRTHRTQIATSSNEIFRCEACGSAFSQIKSLRAHICKEKVHDRELFSCPICGKVASNKSSLKQHSLTHQDASKFKCEHCNYVTNDHNSFRRHKIIHDNSKMYCCKFCDYKCIQSNLYQKHILRTHPSEADQVIFKCPTCSFSTINKAKYNLHIAKHGDAAIQADDPYNNNHLKDCTTFASPAAPMHPDSSFSSKIKVKSDLLLTDPTKLSVGNPILLQAAHNGIT